MLGNPERLCVTDDETLGDCDALLHLLTDVVALAERDELTHGLNVGERDGDTVGVDDHDKVTVDELEPRPEGDPREVALTKGDANPDEDTLEDRDTLLHPDDDRDALLHPDAVSDDRSLTECVSVPPRPPSPFPVEDTVKLGDTDGLCVTDGETLGDCDALLHLDTDTVSLGVRDTLPHGLNVEEVENEATPEGDP